MTRKEFLQFVGGSVVILFGLGNLIALLAHFSKTADESKTVGRETTATNGFGSRKFGA